MLSGRQRLSCPRGSCPLPGVLPLGWRWGIPTQRWQRGPGQACPFLSGIRRLVIKSSECLFFFVFFFKSHLSASPAARVVHVTQSGQQDVRETP